MAWWAWIAFGTLLLAAELMVIDAGFYLVFAGVAAVIVGLGVLTGIGGPEWAQWLAFAALSAVLMVSFRRELYNKLRGNLPGYDNSDSGKTLALPNGLESGTEARVEYRGSSWKVVHDGKLPIPAGGKAVIERTEGTTLHVRAPEESSHS
ncbi:MAG: NfeD family protein [Xanthomonadales bacterium]|nr:NfeD family protein [Xanthomonadales bacterium]